MPKSKREQVLAHATGLAASVANRLRKQRGIVGRVARALDDELQLTYAAQCAKYEDDLIDRIVGPQPVPDDLKVSIVLPTYDVPLPYAKELVESIEGQTYGNWEVCICDDADPRVDVRNWLAGLVSERPDRFRMVRHPENRGIAEATRSAVALVTGDLVAFVDEDDLLHRRALEAVVSRFAADDEVDLVYTDNDRATDLGFRHGPVRKPAWFARPAWTSARASSARAFQAARIGTFATSWCPRCEKWPMSRFRSTTGARAPGRLPHTPMPSPGRTRPGCGPGFATCRRSTTVCAWSPRTRGFAITTSRRCAKTPRCRH
jgi:hypothetical protein